MPIEQIERNTKIIKLWNQGELSMTQLGERFGTSRSGIAGILSRAKNAGQEVRMWVNRKPTLAAF